MSVWRPEPSSAAGRRGLATAAWLAAAGMAAAAPAGAQPAGEASSGRFEIRIGGRPAAVELYAVRPQGGGRMAVGRVTAAGTGRGSFEVGLEVDGRQRPVRYELRPGDESLPSVVATRAGPRLRVVTSGAEGERSREFLASDDLMIVERGVAHHHLFVAERALAGGGAPRRVGDALRPLAGERVAVVLRSVEEGTVDVGGSARPARRLELVFGAEVRHVWVGAAGELLRVEVPAEGWVAVRLAGRAGAP